MPPTRPAAEHVEICKGTEVIDMKMRDEHLVEFIQRETTSDVVGDRALAEIEDEVLPISQLHEHGTYSSGLT